MTTAIMILAMVRSNWCLLVLEVVILLDLWTILMLIMMIMMRGMKQVVVVGWKIWYMIPTRMIILVSETSFVSTPER